MKLLKRAGALAVCLLMLFTAACAERLPDEQLMRYYQNSIVVGDSIPRMLRNYIAGIQEDDPSYFEGMRFFCYYNYRLRTAAREYAAEDEVNLVLKGTDYSLCHLMATIEPDKVFILAGLNDKIGEKIDTGMEYVEEIVRLQEKYAPATQVYFFSLTPVTYRVEEERPGITARWTEYNRRLAQKCEEVGALYVDITTALRNENGFLPMEWAHDSQYHLNAEGNAVWAQALLDYAQSRYDAGMWTPEDGGY